MSMLKADAITIGYGKKPVLRDLSFQLSKGELISLIGVNGSGKSTLLRTIGGLQPLLHGSMEVNGKAVNDMSSAERARNISVVLTGRPVVGWLDVRTLISLGRQPWTDRIGRLTETDRNKIDQAMELTGTEQFADRSIAALSDGELQKVLIARALAQDTPLMLLDEPTAFLDLVNRVQIVRLLKEIVHSTGKTALISTHDLQTAIALSDRLMIVDEGRIWIGSPADAIDGKILERAFSRAGVKFDPATMSFR